MTPPFAKAVDPVFLYVLKVLEQIGTGETIAPEEVRVHIRDAIRVAEAHLGQGPDWQLAKYALATWIDEVLIEANWIGRDWWRENALEVELFNTRSAYEQFYVRATEAGRLPRRDALEVFYVCVVLGFRGLYRERPESEPASIAEANAERAAALEGLGLPADLETWAKRTALAIKLGQDRPALPESGASGMGAPPLEGQTLLLWSSLTGAVLAAFTFIFGYLMFLR